MLWLLTNVDQVDIWLMPLCSVILAVRLSTDYSNRCMLLGMAAVTPVFIISCCSLQVKQQLQLS
jgi:hypothetical protein